jgi:hypothetical protein
VQACQKKKKLDPSSGKMQLKGLKKKTLTLDLDVKMKIISMHPKNFNFGFPSHFRVLKSTELVWTHIEPSSINWKKSHSSANVYQVTKSEN